MAPLLTEAFKARPRKPNLTQYPELSSLVRKFKDH